MNTLHIRVSMPSLSTEYTDKCTLIITENCVVNFSDNIFNLSLFPTDFNSGLYKPTLNIFLFAPLTSFHIHFPTCSAVYFCKNHQGCKDI